MPDLDAILAAAPVIPVLVVDRVDQAVSIAQALIEGGLPVLEVTLRTPSALDAIRAMKSVPGAIVGAGTVLDSGQFDAAVAAGAEFVVSPGLTQPLGRHAAAASVPFLPGVATASEIMAARDLGFVRLKFFPAVAAGGLSALKAHASVFRDLKFCPTGGITPQTASDWLALPCVPCVGGSWLAPAGEDPDLEAIRSRAAHAALLRRRRH